MSESSLLVNRLLESDGIHAFVLVCEAADKYLPMVESLTVVLANGKSIKVTDIDHDVAQKVTETRKTLLREDRITWALRHYKKALVEELLWMTRNEPAFFKERFGAPPAPEQPTLARQQAKLSAVDLSAFEEGDPNFPDPDRPPVTGYSTIDAINARLGEYLKSVETYGPTEQDNVINRLIFQQQSFGEIISMFRRGEVELMKRYAAAIKIEPAHHGKYDLRDEEGPAETIVKFPNGWRWLNLHRNCSEIRNDPQAPSNKAITGHCANTAAKGDVDVLELVEPLGSDRWRHHAMFVLEKGGLLGERKGRKNQKPSPRLAKYILELLRQYKPIKGLRTGDFGHMHDNNFLLSDLPKPYLDSLKHDRPELFRKAKRRRLR